MLRRVWKSRRLMLHTKLTLYKTLVRSVLTYGCESWYDNETISRRFTVFENKALRRILKVKWQDKVTNASIREVTQVPWLDEVLMTWRWRWFGHVMRREPTRIVTSVHKWRPDGSRRRGRPRPTWLRTMQREAAERWENIEERAADRGAWREFTKALCVRRRWRR